MGEEIKKREALLEEMRRIDGIEWMHNKECNSDITIDLFDIRNERWFGWFSRNPRTDEMLLYGQSAKYEGGAKWRIENIETSVLEQIVKRLQFIDRKGKRLPHPKPGYYSDRLNLRLNCCAKEAIYYW